jgi:hypothetical protein
MHWLIRIFNKAFVSRFYQAHLLVFLFVTLAMFGMADGGTVIHIHYYLLLTSFSSAYTLFFLWLAWLLYAANALRYMLNTLGKQEFQFLYVSNSAHRGSLLKALTWTVLQINAPVLIYGFIGIVIAITKSFYVNAILGAFALSCIMVLSVIIVYFRLVNLHTNPFFSGIKLFPAIRFKPGMLSITLRRITNDNKVALIGTKLFSCAVIYGAHYEWASFNYDIRWMQVAMAISIPAQGVLLYQVWSFETNYLSFTRNFPIEIIKRYLRILSLVLILVIPEVALLLSYCLRFHVLWQLPVYLLYATSLPMLLYAMLFTRGFNHESFNSFLFAIGLATFFVTLFGFTWLLSIAFVPIGFLVYRESFYEFEIDGK